MSSVLASIWFALTRIPIVIKAAVLHTLGLTNTSKKWDLRTALTVTFLREFIGNAPPSTITQQQAMFAGDPKIKGNIWVSKTALPPPPEDDLRQALFEAIAALGNGNEEYSKPGLEPVGGEWVGYRPNVSSRTPEPSISEKEKYENLVKDSKNPDITVLSFHGGSYYLMDPATTRPTSSIYATLSGGRVFSVRYRLAPQNPFPAALLDALVAYLSLLHPPLGAFHEPIPSSSIVLTGDSAGGNLATVLLQTLLHMQRVANAAGEGEPTILFHGKRVPIPLPAGVALNSPSMDISRSLQSIPGLHTEYDYLPPTSRSPALISLPCKVWPTEPRRVDLFCEGSALCHPLVSPLAVQSWEGSPPVFIVCGEEMLAEECKIVAQRMAKQGVTVVWEQYEAMPHCFALLLGGTKVADMSFDGWVRFVSSSVREKQTLKSSSEYIAAKTLERREVDITSLAGFTDEEVLSLMNTAREEAIQRPR